MRKREILIVDDEEVIRDVFKEAFSEEAFTVYCASSAEEAQKILSKKSIQVISLDLQLPGIRGDELCKQLRKDMPTAIIIAITGYTSIFDLIKKCRDAGFDDYFPNPFDLNQLIRAANYSFEKLDRWKSR